MIKLKNLLTEETGGSAEEFANKIEGLMRKHFPNSTYVVQYGKNLTEHIHISFALGQKQDWYNGYFENSPVSYRAMIFGIKDGKTTDNMRLEANTGASIMVAPPADSYLAYKRIRITTRKTKGGEDAILRAIEKVLIALKKTTKDNLDNFKGEETKKWVKKYI